MNGKGAEIIRLFLFTLKQKKYDILKIIQINQRRLIVDNLLKNRAKAVEDAKRQKNVEKIKKTVTYALDGRAVKDQISKKKKAGLSVLITISCLASAIYIPPVFYSEKSDNTSVPITPDVSAIKVYQTYLKDHPDADFDKDGLSNAMEAENGTDPWECDTDWDGVTDYAELYITETSPVNASTVMLNQVENKDKAEGNTVNTPYKIDDIIFWPDDYSSKAFGGVVRTMWGYRFCNYNGWVRFPEKVYAYGYRNGVHYELKYRENEDAWYIGSSDEIRLYSEPLSFVHCFKLPFINSIYLKDNGFSRFLTDILPSQGGLITCHRAAVIDTQPSTKEDTMASLRSPLINRDATSRFGQNMNTLKDLSWVRKLIEADQCVAVSLYSSNAGEAIGIVYGYTKDGSLLVADENLNPVGELSLTEWAMNRIDKDGTIAQDSWFEFKGLGFDSSKYGDRISFFASTITEASSDLSGVAPSAVESAAVMQAETEGSEIQYEDTGHTEETPEQTEPETEQETEISTERQTSVMTFGF